MFACWVPMENQFVAMVARLSPVVNETVQHRLDFTVYEVQYSDDLSF